MAVQSGNTDPLKTYVTNGSPPPLTTAGLVYNKIYAHIGVVDALTNTNTTGYTDPNFNALRASTNGQISFNQMENSEWISGTDFGGTTSNPVIITYNLVNTIYYNNINLQVLNVPCFVELLDNNLNSLPGDSTFIVAGGNDIFTTTDWVPLNYNAPSTNTGSFTYPLTGVTSLNVRITRNRQVQSSNPIYGLSNVAYSVGLQSFRVKLNVQSITDIPVSVVSGTKGIITQNRWGFVENYSYAKNSVSNIFVNDSTYWKSAPQPTGDSIVYFYAKVSDPTPTSINRFYIDPIYSNCSFNAYYTTQTINPALITGTSSNFETGLGGWSSSNSYWTALQDSTYSHSGKYSLKATRVSATGNASVGYTINAPTPFTQYTFSVYVIGDATSIGKTYRVSLKDQGFATFSIENFVVTGSWQQVILTATIPTNVTTMHIYISDDPQNPSFTNGASIWIDDVTLNTGSSVGQIDPGTFTWIPIQKDFILRKGIYEIPDINCTYLKFEFTSLIPEVYDLPFDSIQRTANVFPLDVENFYQNIENGIIDGNSVKYSTLSSNLSTNPQNNNNLSASTVFGVSSTTINNWPSLSALNQSQIPGASQGLNTASQIIDPSKSYKLIDQNGNYNNSTYTQILQRRFPYVGTHNYNQITIQQTWHQAYFTGIRYLSFFNESVYDQFSGTPTNLIAKNGTTSGFASQNANYVGLNTDDIAVTPWFSSIDSFKSFNIAGLTTDWNSFLTQGNVINYDNTFLNNLSAAQINSMQINSQISYLAPFGKASAYTVSGVSGQQYGIKSTSYYAGNNIMNYYDANFLTTSDWYAPAGSSSTITNVASGVAWVNGTTNGTASGVTVSGGTYQVAYNFTIPNLYSASGTSPWTVQLGSESIGTVGYATYAPASGVSYYFLTSLQSSGTTNVTMYTQFINSTTNGIIAGTTVTGTTANLANASGNNVIVATSSSFASSSGYPSNTIQLVLSGSASVPYMAYQAGAFGTPATVWSSPADRTNMRVSGAIRVFFPNTNNGAYRASLYGVDVYNNQSELSYKLYNSNNIPLNTWFDIELTGYTAYNYSSFYVQLKQLNTSVQENFIISMLAPFYHPIRYEFTNVSGTSITATSGWTPITIGVNNPEYFISTASGVAASGIQIRMTALDSNVFISSVKVVPTYKQSPYYAGLEIDYQGNSKTNELDARRSLNRKPSFQLNQNVYPSSFTIPNIAGTVISYQAD